MYVTGMSLRKERKKGKFGYSSESEEEKEDEQKADEQKVDEQSADQDNADYQYPQPIPESQSPSPMELAIGGFENEQKKKTKMYEVEETIMNSIDKDRGAANTHTKSEVI